MNTSNRATELVDEIAKASEKEANSITQVTLDVDQISEVVRQIQQHQRKVQQQVKS